MTPRELQTEILNGPHAAACAPFVHDNTMPAISAAEVKPKDAAIAEILNGNLKQIVRRKIGVDDMLGELGVADGSAIYEKLQTLAAGSTPVRLALGLLERNKLDIAHPQTQAAINSLPAPVTADEKSALLGMAYQPVSISMEQVGVALRGPWGDE